MDNVDINDFTFDRTNGVSEDHGVDIDNDMPRKQQSEDQTKKTDDNEAPAKHSEDEDDDLRDELIKLAENKEINKTVAYIKKASRKTLERIYERYQRDQLKETNEMVTDMIIIKSAELLEHMTLIKSGGETGRKLQNKKMFRRDLNKMVSWFTPLFPMIGLLEGGLTVGSDIFSHQMTTERNDKCSEPPNTEG